MKLTKDLFLLGLFTSYFLKVLALGCGVTDVAVLAVLGTTFLTFSFFKQKTDKKELQDQLNLLRKEVTEVKTYMAGMKMNAARTPAFGFKG